MRGKDVTVYAAHPTPTHRNPDGARRGRVCDSSFFLPRCRLGEVSRAKEWLSFPAILKLR